MLKKLTIQNYAIIDELEIDFSKQLNIITGETGAGKSILMGALSLILGDRADSSALPDKSKKCFVEGNFDIGGKPAVTAFLEEHDLDIEEELVIRREITAGGKSRAFVNDTPVNLEQLRALSSLLVDLHRQFDTIELGSEQFQMNVIDALASHGNMLQQFQQAYQIYQEHQQALQKLIREKDDFVKDYDYNKFLYDELEQAAFRENELEDAEQQLRLLTNAEAIKTALAKADYILQGGESPVVQQLKTIHQQLQQFSDDYPALGELLQRLQSAQIELDDIAAELEGLNDGMVYDAAAIENLNERIALGYRLQKKHGVSDTAGLLTLQESLSVQLTKVLNIDDQIAALEKTVQNDHQVVLKMAEKISAQRKKQIAPFEKNVNELLHKVGMPNARLKVVITDDQRNLKSTGIDIVEFLFDANKSGQFKPVGKVASGGELSRLMLCIKSLVAESIDLPTLIFDEIDTGISGEAARQVGIIMKSLASRRQVLCITHQPQIAGKADAHFFVYKEMARGQVQTNIRLLLPDERIEAIARMLSGETPTAAALENAREMMR